MSWCAQRCHSVLGVIAAIANQGILGCYSSQPMANTYFQVNPTPKGARLRFPTAPMAPASPAWVLALPMQPGERNTTLKSSKKALPETLNEAQIRETRHLKSAMMDSFFISQCFHLTKCYIP